MKAEELLKGLDFSYDHFTKLTGTGIEPDNVNIAQFAEDYHEYKLNLLGISGVLKPLKSNEGKTVEVKTLDDLKIAYPDGETYMIQSENSTLKYFVDHDLKITRPLMF